MTVRNSESTTQVGELAAKLRAQIIDLSRQAGAEGITSNEAERLIPVHKNNSISPRFAELIKRGGLVRVLLGYTEKKRAVYAKRFDPVTRRHVVVNFLREFAPTKSAATAQFELPYSGNEGA